MKRNFKQFCAVTLLALSNYTYGQGTFVNLDFESVIPPLNPDFNFSVPITNALPGWTGYINGTPRDRVVYNGFSLGGPSISVVDSLSPYFQPIQGSYSVYLKSTSDTGGKSAAIGQIGQIPSGAQSLLFLIADNTYLGASFAGHSIPLIQFGTSGNNIIMAGDISMFAGQTGELRFGGTGLFDDIQFSNQTIPEPSTFGLCGLGALFLGWRWRNRMKTLMRVGFASVKVKSAFLGGAARFTPSFMKAKILLLTWLSSFATIASMEAQGTFQNLDFENANISGRVFNRLPAADAFPGWSVNTPLIFYDDVSLSGGSISICDSNSPFSGVNHIQGSYFVFLASVNTPGPGNDFTISLGQTGQIPLLARSIEFWGSIGNMQITFAGQSLDFSTLATTANYNVYGADITAFAGQTGQLLFALPPFTGNAFLDNIQFSPQVIPEPSTICLFGLGAVLLGWRWRRV